MEIKKNIAMKTNPLRQTYSTCKYHQIKISVTLCVRKLIFNFPKTRTDIQDINGQFVWNVTKKPPSKMHNIFANNWLKI